MTERRIFHVLAASAVAALALASSQAAGSAPTAPFQGPHGMTANSACESAPPLGTPRSDVITGTTGPDVIDGLGGNDTIYGGKGEDIICGGNGKDTLSGGDGHDILYGDADADTLSGDGGPDYLDGGGGRDKMYGRKGKDLLCAKEGVKDSVIDGGADYDCAQVDAVDPLPTVENWSTASGACGCQ